jgi:NRAMP (natural resistance-associated macrophage protein)-like metal ion transporter
LTTDSSRKGRDKEDEGADDKDDNSVNYEKDVPNRKPARFLPKAIFLKSLGPGIITGASDDDPSGIATYSQAGAQFGFGMLWLALFQYPLMIIVQEMCARIGLVTGNGLAAVMRQKYSSKTVFPIALLLIANTVNIGADIGAMAASIRLVFPIYLLLWQPFPLLHLLLSQKFLCLT